MRGLLVKENDLWIINISVFAKRQSNFKHADFGMEFDMRPCHGLRLREGTACITVRKNPTRLVKHPDSLWETSVVCTGSMAKAFPTSLPRDMWRLDQVSPIESFSLCPSPDFVLHCPSCSHLTNEMNKSKLCVVQWDECLSGPEMKCQKWWDDLEIQICRGCCLRFFWQYTQCNNKKKEFALHSLSPEGSECRETNPVDQLGG